MVPLRTRLKNGDIVEIVTAAGHKPSRDWLNFVVTSHARYKIKHLIRLEERTRAIDLGRKVFEKEARRYDLSPKGIQETEAFAKALADANAQKPDDLFALIGYGTLSAKQLLGKLVPADGLREKAADGRVTAAVKRVFGAGEEKIKVRGSDRGAGVAGSLLQPDPGREDRRLHHSRQRGVGPLRHLSERRQPAVRFGTPHRGRVGQVERGCCRPIHREADDGGGGSQGGARGRQREDRRHQHQHQETWRPARIPISMRAST